ncbi:hypothetical protein [Salinarchaeum sp. Harcht-Bsk1]|uniref:hypothetical protein n=1 Tax=Salinarchaeum sp. Harcht-Bsk1 TaxID=1333523 RepID=UPI000677C9FA|nr:hypothetical protein [Salinarchaeum sp. Harcht-Bsk1]
MATTEPIEERVKRELRSREPVDQDDFVAVMEPDMSRQRLLNALRNLMQDDEVSYTVEWELQVEE